MPNFDIDALRAVVVGVDLGSFSKAASQLGRSPSSISMQVRKLEQQAGRPLFRKRGRGLEPTEAGDMLLDYARRIVALNDEAAAGLGATGGEASVRIGLPQDFFEDVMPEVIRRFAVVRPGVHVEVRAGRNFALQEEVQASRIDAALAFFRPEPTPHADLVASLPLYWLGASQFQCDSSEPLPLILFDHPCLFRSTALQTLESAGRRWRLSLTTPSLPGVWAALRLRQGISVRTGFAVPRGMVDLGEKLQLEPLPPIELRLLAASEMSPAARDLYGILRSVVTELEFGAGPGS